MLEQITQNIDSLTALLSTTAVPLIAVMTSSALRSKVISTDSAPMFAILCGMVIGVLLNTSLVGWETISALLGLLVGGTAGAGAVGVYEATKKL